MGGGSGAAVAGPAADGDRGEDARGVVVTVGAARRGGGRLRHRTLDHEPITAGAAAELVRRHAPSVRLRDSAGQEQPRVGHHGAHVGEELRRELTVDDPVVEGHRQRDHLADGELPFVHPRARRDGAEADDRALPRVEDRGAAVDAEDADVRDAERAAGQVRGAGVPLARGGDERVQRGGELRQRRGSRRP